MRLSIVKSLRWLANKIETKPDADPNKKFLIQDKNGNDWYEYVDILRISMQRSLQLQSAQKMLEMSVTKDYLEACLAEIVEAINKGKLNEVAVITRELQVRLKMIVERECLINMMAVIFMLNDEDLGSVDDKVFLKKVELIKADGELQDFFLQKYLTLYYNSTESLLTDFQNYLTATDQETQKLKDLAYQFRSKIL